MTLHEEQQKVQKAMESTLSGLQEDPWLTQRVLANAKGEEPVKKKLSTALVLCIVLGLAIIGTAYAILSSSQVAEFFGQHWNQDLGTRLQEGKIAQIGESVTVGDAVITLDEIVYRDRGIYGVGTVRPVHEGDVLFAMDTADLLMSSHEEEFHPEIDPSSPVIQEYYAALSLIEKAKASGGKMLTAQSMPLTIGVDEGTMLMPGTIGYYDIRNEDGSLTFSFEASDGFVVNEGTTYQIQMESVVTQINDEGYPINGAKQRSTWTVSCAPVFISEPKETPVEAGKVTVKEQNGYEVITPSDYQETGTMPVYQAIETNLETAIKPEWLDTSGIASGEGTQDIHFSHHAVLSYGPEAAFYDEFADDQYSESYSGAIMRIVWIKDWKQHEGKFNLEKTSLSGITLEDAKKQAEALITKIGLDCNQYVCRYELDMSLDRIRNMGAIYEQSIVDGSLMTDDDWVPYNYDAIPASEEGFYLEYRPAMIDAADATHRYELVFFVNSRGIVCAHLRNQFNMGDIVEKPDKLITSDEAVARLYEEVNRSQYGADEHVVSIRKIVLSYVPVRASNKDAGMVFVPTWEIIYDDEKAGARGYDCNAFGRATDGTLIEASCR